MAEFDSPQYRGDAGSRMNPGDMPEQDSELSKKILLRYRQATGFRAPYDSSWDRYRRNLLGDQWANKLRAAWKARPVYNYSWAHIQTIAPMMTENKPSLNVVSEKPDRGETCDIATAGVRYVLDENDAQLLYNKVIVNAHTYGTGVSKQWYSAKRNRICVDSVDTRYFFVSPGAMDLQEAEYVMYVCNRWIPSVEREFPEAVGKIPAGLWDDKLTHRPVDTQSQTDKDGAFAFPDSAAVTALATQPTVDDSQQATVCEMWDRDDAGNVWRTVTANGYILSRKPSPFKHGKYPFAIDLCYPVSGQFWGMGEMAQLESPQDSINRSEAMILDYARMCSSAMLAIPRSARISTKDITNRVGGFLVFDGEKPPFWIQPPGSPPWLFNIVQSAKLHMDNLTGVHDASRGQLPAGKLSGIAIAQLQQATGGRVGLKTRLFEIWLREVGMQVLSLMQQFWFGKSLRLGSKLLSVNEMGEDGKVMNDISGDDLSVEIGVGSTLPVDKGVRFDQSIALYQAGAMSLQQLLRDTGRTDDEVERIISEIKTEKVQAAGVEGRAQALAQNTMARLAKPPPAPPGGPAGPGGPPASGVPGGGAGMDPQQLQAAERDMAEGGGHSQLPSEEEIAALEGSA